MKELNNCNCIPIKINNSRYVFDYINCKTMKVDQDEYSIFEYLIKNRSLPTDSNYHSKILKIIRNIKKGFFFTEKEVTLYARDKDKYNSIISFPIVHKCNLACKYCFANSGENYKEPIKKFDKENFDEILKFINKNIGNIDNMRIEFVSGGEPLIDKVSFIQYIEYIKSKLSLSNIKAKVFTVTNGTTLDENIINFFNEHELSMGISMDGPINIHDYHRPFKDGSPSYELIIDNINRTIESKDRSKLWIISVVTSHTSSLKDILSHNISIGSKSMEMRVMRGSKDNKLALNDENLEKFKELYSSFSQYLKGNPSYIIYILNDYDTFGKVIKRLLVEEKIIYRCQAGRSKFSFTANGDIYPCDSFVGNEAFKIGNIWTKHIDLNIINMFNDMNVNNIEICKKCEYKYLCGGDCYYNYYLNDSHSYCEFSKHLCNLAIDLLFTLKEHDLKLYNKLRNLSKQRYKLN